MSGLPGTGPTRCRRCACGLIPTTAYKKATPENRAEWIAKGMRRNAGRGLCGACYITVRGNGELGNYAPIKGSTPSITATATPCPRCGIATLRPLCVDCVDVVDPAEQTAWAS